MEGRTHLWVGVDNRSMGRYRCEAAFGIALKDLFCAHGREIVRQVKIGEHVHAHGAEDMARASSNSAPASPLALPALADIPVVGKKHCAMMTAYCAHPVASSPIP